MQLIAILITMALALPVLAILRAIMARRIQALMKRKSELEGSGRPPLADTPEVPAKTVPRLEKITGDSISAEAEEARQVAAGRARSLFRMLWVYEAAACAAYVALPFLVSFEIQPVMAMLAGIYLVLISARYLFYVRQYRAVRGVKRLAGFRSLFFMTLMGPIQPLIHPRYSWLQFSGVAVVAAVMAFTVAPTVAVSAAILVALGIHATLRVRLYRQSQDDPNRRLLVLRVFNMNKSAFLTFGHVLDYWRHFGSSFTVVDPSYFRFKYRGFSEGNVALVFWVSTLVQLLTAVAIMGSADEQQPAGLEVVYPLVVAPFVAVLLIVGYIVFQAFLFVRAPSSFASSGEQIREKTTRLLDRPRRWDLTFKDLHMYCFDNTWRLAVAEFVGIADVVLMDLRGFSDKRKGCEYEVDFLLDYISIDRIVFLVDEGSDQDAIHHLVRARWEHLKVNSPNLSVQDPVARIYASSDQRAADVGALLGLMFEAAARNDEAPARSELAVAG